MKKHACPTALIWSFLFLTTFPSKAVNQNDVLTWWIKNHLKTENTVHRQTAIGLRSTDGKSFRLDSIITLAPDTATMMETTPQKNVFH
jgi:hypothetical protein